MSLEYIKTWMIIFGLSLINIIMISMDIPVYMVDEHGDRHHQRVD